MSEHPNSDHQAQLSGEGRIDEALERALREIIASTYSHVDGRNLLAELHPRNMLTIKRRVDGREKWFQGDWLSDLWRAVKKAEALLACDDAPHLRPLPEGEIKSNANSEHLTGVSGQGRTGAAGGNSRTNEQLAEALRYAAEDSSRSVAKDLREAADVLQYGNCGYWCPACQEDIVRLASSAANNGESEDKCQKASESEGGGVGGQQAMSTYQPGDPAPEGYLQWHAWADAQHKAGLRQKQCGRCGLWKFPQELTDKIDRCEMQSRKGPVTVASLVCIKCAGNAGVLPQPKASEKGVSNE